MKPRSDSLWSKLTPEQRDELLVFLVERGGPYEDAVTLCASWGLQVGASSLSRFVSRHGLPWRLERARAASSESASSLPKDWAKQKRQGMAAREFELTFRDLSVKEWALLKALEIDERKQTLKETIEPKRLQLAERKVVMLEAREAQAKSALGASGLTDTERVARMRQVFGVA